MSDRIEEIERDAWSANNADDMLKMGRRALAEWRQSKEKSAAERHAARLIAFAFGRLDEMAKTGALPDDWNPS